MKPLIELRDEDVFPKEFLVPKPPNFISRTAVRIILVDGNGCIALVGTRYRLLPGGGVEENESLEDAVKRECLEETGCLIKIDEYLGFTEEWRYKEGRHQTSHCFYGKLEGEKGIPQSTQEDEVGMKVDWFDKKDIIQFIESQEKNMLFQSYHSHFNSKIHLAFLNKFMSLKI